MEEENTTSALYLFFLSCSQLRCILRVVEVMSEKKEKNRFTNRKGFFWGGGGLQLLVLYQ